MVPNRLNLLLLHECDILCLFVAFVAHGFWFKYFSGYLAIYAIISSGFAYSQSNLLCLHVFDQLTSCVKAHREQLSREWIAMRWVSRKKEPPPSLAQETTKKKKKHHKSVWNIQWFPEPVEKLSNCQQLHAFMEMSVPM